MAIKRRDFQKLSSTVQEFLLKLPDEEDSARLRDNLLHALHFLQLYYRILQNRDKNNDPLQWNIDHSLSPLTPFKEAPDKFEWEWINADSQKVRNFQNAKGSLDNFKVTPQILTAIKEGDLNTVKNIVKQDPQSVNSYDVFTRDCLTYAIQYDQLEILKFLLKNGANVNNVASDASTSLHRAVYQNNPEMVQLLLDFNANINSQDCFNRSPLHWGVVCKDIDCLKILLKFLPDLSIKDKDGMSPCMWACHLDHLEHFKLLSKIENKKSNELETDNDGRTWIHWSVRKNEPFQCLNFLINGETAMIRDKEGKTCLHVAAEQGALQACKFILETVGSKIINERDNKKQTPLHLATLNGHARTIKLLMDNGADANLKDQTGASSIDYVTKRNLFFCNSIIEVCLRNFERKNRQGGASSSNSVASSFNGSESNLTPAPPTTPKNTFTRSFQQLVPNNNSKDLTGRPPRPSNANSSLNFSTSETTNGNGGGEVLNKTAPGNLISVVGANSTYQQQQQEQQQQQNLRNTILIPPSPPTGGVRTRPNHRGGWNSVERVASGSLRLSRASTRTSLASDDLDKYMNNNDNFGGSLGNLENINPSLPKGFNLNEKQLIANNPINSLAPLPQPRVSSNNNNNNNNIINNNNNNGSSNGRIFSGRSQETGLSTASYDPPSSHVPPPVKPRKSSSVANLNSASNDNQSFNNKMNSYYSNENNFANQAINTTYIKNDVLNKSNTSLNVEDISGDEVSIASVKGEGDASEISDNETTKTKYPHHHYLTQPPTSKLSKKHSNNSEQLSRRPTTPMDIRNFDKNGKQQSQPGGKPLNQVESNVDPVGHHHRGMSIRNQQIGEQHHVSNRFNEWDPYKQQQSNQINNERQKSPQKTKQQQQQQQVPQNQQSSNFAHTFLNTDASPRQTSGRSQLGSANNQKLQMSPQHNTNNNNTNNTNNQQEINQSSSLELVVSGQKLGGRKDLSPTNTPRDMSQYQQPQSLRPFTRRLQPLDKIALEMQIQQQQQQILANTVNEGQFLKQKKTAIDRKKLEPIKGMMNSFGNNTSHLDALTGLGITEIDRSGTGSATLTNHYNDEELTLSENTISSSDKQLNNIRASRKKGKNQNGFNQNQNRKNRIIEPVNNETNEALKM